MNPAEGSTIIGKSVVIRGDLSGQEDLYLDCDIEGSITVPDNRLTIGPGARVVANVTVRDLIVLGRLTGNVQASGRVELRQSASLNGDIAAQRLSIEESAVLKGRVELKNATSQTAAAPQTSVTPQKASAPVATAQPLAFEPRT
ncbi:MAG TPA: polymer-forming cytoskeletal protein [Edaphobacter sp.]|nr:polymer-forming cytoskeletal protein [Edaphobacter sp.]